MVSPKNYELAARNLARFPVVTIDIEGLLIDALKEAAKEAKVNWELVVKTDSKPNEGDWDRLMLLVGRAIPKVQCEILKHRSDKKTLLFIYTGLLARYEQMAIFEILRDEVGKRDGIHGVWILVPGDDLPLVDGKPIPVLGAGQCTKIPASWLSNEHRSNGSRAASESVRT